MLSNFLISRVSKQVLYKHSERFVHIFTKQSGNSLKSISPLNVNFRKTSLLKNDVNNTLSNMNIMKTVENNSSTTLSMTTKRTFQPHTKRRKSKHGFLVRLKSSGGRKVIARRIAKGRWRVSV